ncbi:glycoside hydrolase family 26 protein [Kineosporia rhizophila]|uniref:glycosyl hydrolase n=1 Tax=Kineosporia rhizophila TaxID=84633 RepID=UPI001E3DD2D3|nr:glycoside hydrolase family 26 protein [Kineosporia rhizophila]
MIYDDRPTKQDLRPAEEWRPPRRSLGSRLRGMGTWCSRHRTPITALTLITALAAVVTVSSVRNARTTSSPTESLTQQTRPAVVSTPEMEAAQKKDAVRMGVFAGTKLGDVRAFEKWAKHEISYVTDFGPRQTWDDIAHPEALLAEWKGSGYTLVYAVPMLPETLNPDNSMKRKNPLMRQGGKGEYNDHFVTLAENLVQAGQKKAILRVGWEFNLRSWAWGTDDEKLYIDFYREIVDAMRSVPGQDFEFDWNPNNGFNPNPGEKYYPGDKYVDYVGVDVYDLHAGVYPYPKKCDEACRNERQTRAWTEAIYGGPHGLAFWTDFAAQHDKPVALPEWGLWDRFDKTGGGDNPLFIHFMHDYISRPQNNVAYANYFNLNSFQGEHSLTKSFRKSGKEFRELFAQ